MCPRPSLDDEYTPSDLPRYPDYLNLIDCGVVHQSCLPKNCKVIHYSVDVYSSAKDVVEWALPRLSLGSVLIFDDYGFFGCEGVTKYCDEFRENSKFRFIHNLNGHAVFIKVSE